MLCAYLVDIEVGLFLAFFFFFPLLLAVLIGVDIRVGFWHAIDDEEYVFLYSGLIVSIVPFKIW